MFKITIKYVKSKISHSAEMWFLSSKKKHTLKVTTFIN